MHGCLHAPTAIVTNTENSSTPADTNVSASCSQNAPKLMFACQPALSRSASSAEAGKTDPSSAAARVSTARRPATCSKESKVR
eukprot:357218-Chlamydomonas_euryale.AAC.14